MLPSKLFSYFFIARKAQDPENDFISRHFYSNEYIFLCQCCCANEHQEGIWSNYFIITFYFEFQILFANALKKKFKIAILGASGYTGAELMRHPGVSVEVLTADRSAGQEFKAIYPQFHFKIYLPKLSKWEETQSLIESCDVAFCCSLMELHKRSLASLPQILRSKFVKAFSLNQSWVKCHKENSTDQLLHDHR